MKAPSPKRDRSTPDASPEETAASERSGISGAQSIHRALQVVRLLAGSPQGLKLRELADAVGLPHPTVHRILKALEQEGVVDRPPGSRGYVVGRELIWLGLDAYWRFPFNSAVEAALEATETDLQESILVSVAAHHDSVCVVRRGSTGVRKGATARAGERLPMCLTPNGRVMLAFMPPDMARPILDANLPWLKSGTWSQERLATELAAIRSRGYGCTDGLIGSDTFVVSLPVFDRVGVPIAGVSMIAPHRRMSDAYVQKLVKRLKAVVEQIGEQLLRFDIERAKTSQQSPRLDQGLFERG